MAAKPTQLFSRRLKLGLLKARARVAVSDKITTTRKAVKYGAKFMNTFPKIALKDPAGHGFAVSVGASEHESPFSVALKMHSVKTPEQQDKIAEVKLAFTRKGAIIMLPQGVQYKKDWLNRFRRIHKKPWANFLIEKIEEHARKCGFKTAKIPLPEGLVYYHSPYLPEYNEKDPARAEAEVTRIRENMRKLFYGIAENMGYREKGAWLVKEL